MWKVWCRALGQKEFKESDRKSDAVAIIRTVWVVFHVVAMTAIVTNAIQNHGLAGLFGF